MTDLMPDFCPHCLADLKNGATEVKTSNPPKCGDCLLPLWWEDRSGKTPDRPWPSYLEILRMRIIGDGCTGTVVHGEFDFCPRHDR